MRELEQERDSLKRELDKINSSYRIINDIKEMMSSIDDQKDINGT